MPPNQMITAGMEQDRETPGISKRHHVRFFGKEVDVQDSKIRNLFLRHLRSFQSHTLLGFEDCRTTSGQVTGAQHRTAVLT